MSLSGKILSLHNRRYPHMEVRDCVKLLYQSEFGPGHMVSQGDALSYLEEEFAHVLEEGSAPAYTVEAIGGGLCRFHLDPDRLTKEDLPLVARCFVRSAHPRGSRAGLWRKLGELMGMTCRGLLPFSPEEVEEFLADYDQAGCPAIHHSEAFNRAYHPHYRVMDRELAVFFPALQAIDRALRETDGPVIVAVDGRCASGKTTFATLCAQLFDDCNVFHMDDFFLPPELRTPERLAAPGGNVHYERAGEELFRPLSRGEDVTFSPFDCATFTLGQPVHVPFRRLNILEGSYSLHPALWAYSTVKIFLTCEPQKQLKRLESRDPELLEDFQTRWIPMEEAYFKAFAVEKQCDVAVDTTVLAGEESL